VFSRACGYTHVCVQYLKAPDRTWWYRSVIPALRRQQQEIMSSRIDFVSKKGGGLVEWLKW
jgi:hypothetical protein